MPERASAALETMLIDECSLRTPKYLSTSAWIEHTPFAFWLVSKLKPRVYVELGVHNGLSYFTVCQALDELNLGSRCYAVDTWQGDEHAGAYSDAVFKTVVQYNESNYANFSTLLRMQFSEALAHIPDKSVDLLHVDGRHFYNDVKTDFETWIPKLSDRAIVMFHDTAVREHNFGVWKYWAELEQCYPSFNFTHGHGLGILAFGPKLEPALSGLFGLRVSAKSASRIRYFYASRGKEISEQKQHLDECRSIAPTAALARANKIIFRLEDQLAKARGRPLRTTRDFVYFYLSTFATVAMFGQQNAFRHSRHLDELTANYDPKRTLFGAFHIAAPNNRNWLNANETPPSSGEANFYSALLARTNLRITDLQEQVANARGHPLRTLKCFAYFKVLNAASKLPSWMGPIDWSRLRKSAAKRDPWRSLYGKSGITKQCYTEWIKANDCLRTADVKAIKAQIGELAYRPVISVIMPVYETPANYLRQALQSICNQLYPNWELCIADDASSSQHVNSILSEFAARDSRIKVIRRSENGNISAATNSALALASGEFVALMDHDDVLPVHSLYEVAVEINRHPDADMIYSDEDRINDNGDRFSPHFKTDWNPELLLSYNIVCHLSVFRRSIVEAVHGCRTGFEGSQDYDLALRISRRTTASRIRHIPAILYHWRAPSGKTSFSQTQHARCRAAAQLAKAEHLSALGQTATVETHPILPIWDRVRRKLPDTPPLVSIIIPTRNKADLLGACLEGILNRTTYNNLEVIIIDHATDEPDAIALLERLSLDPRVRIIKYSGEFNYSDMNNKAVGIARGDLLAFLNNDVDVINPDWLSEMVCLAVIDTYGAVGAKLLYPSTQIQHAGVYIAQHIGPDHYFKGFEANAPGYFGRALLPTNLSAVTGACLVVRRSVFLDVDGFNSADFKVSYNDVDLCLKLASRGLLNVWTPYALLYHHESPTRGRVATHENRKLSQTERAFLGRRWSKELEQDPFYNINLDFDGLVGPSFRPTRYSRRLKPWRGPT